MYSQILHIEIILLSFISPINQMFC